MDVATRSADWLGEVIDLMRGPASTMPVPALLAQLRRTFCGSTSSWDWFDAGGSFGMVMDPAEVPLNEKWTLDLWLTGELFDSHALVRWFSSPATCGRRPRHGSRLGSSPGADDSRSSAL